MALPVKKKKIDRSKCTVLTPEFRVSYPHVFKAQSPKEADKKKFSITMLFPKDSDLSGIKEAMKQAKLAEYGAKENWPDGLQSPVSDGDTHIDKVTGKVKEGYKGCWVIKATSGEDQKPVIADENGDDLIDQAQFYAGCYARASILASAWEYMGKEGVGFYINGIQKLRDGKPFGNRKTAKELFSPVGTGKSEDFDDAADEDFT